MQAALFEGKPALRYGLLAGLITAALFIILYFTNKPLAVSPVVYYSSLLIFLAAMYLALRADFGETGEMVGWRDALRTAFAVYLVANALFWVAYYVLHQMDPELVEIQRESMRQWYPRILPKDQLAEGLRELENADLQLTLRKALFGYARGAIAGFFWAALLTWLYRRGTFKF